MQFDCLISYKIITVERFPVLFQYLSTWWGRDSSVGIAIATGWTVRGSNPGGGEIFRSRPHRLWGPPSLLYNGYRGHFRR
jgi:hypothetical protein